MDRADMAVKALSWALRALTATDAPAVRAFLTRHADTIAPRVYREVGSKLTTRLKNPRPDIAQSPIENMSALI